VPANNAAGWLILMAIGMASATALWLFNRWLEKQAASREGSPGSSGPGLILQVHALRRYLAAPAGDGAGDGAVPLATTPAACFQAACASAGSLSERLMKATTVQI